MSLSMPSPSPASWNHGIASTAVDAGEGGLQHLELSREVLGGRHGRRHPVVTFSLGVACNAAKDSSAALLCSALPLQFLSSISDVIKCVKKEIYS